MTGRLTEGDSPVGRDRGLEVFYSIAAQVDNLGDAVIRRNVLRWITDSAVSVHVFRGEMSDSYMEAVLGSGSRVKVHGTSASFTNAWLKACQRRRCALILAPGPRLAGRDGSSILSAAKLSTMIGLTRASGGPALVVGGAIDGRSGPALGLHRTCASMCTHYSVRDGYSRQLLGNRGHVIPDVAFDDASPSEAIPDDPALVISLRFDRSADRSALKVLAQRCREAGVEPLMLTQVRRDHERHQAIATELGIAHVGWTDQSHLQQLDRMDAVYRRAIGVYSDRLHACIFGAIHGAGIVNAEHGSAKLSRTLSTVYPRDLLTGRATENAGEIVEGLVARRAFASTWVRDAADKLTRERRRVATHLRHGQLLAESDAWI